MMALIAYFHSKLQRQYVSIAEIWERQKGQKEKKNDADAYNPLILKRKRKSRSVVSDSSLPHGLHVSMEFSRPEYWSG